MTNLKSRLEGRGSTAATQNLATQSHYQQIKTGESQETKRSANTHAVLAPPAYPLTRKNQKPDAGCEQSQRFFLLRSLPTLRRSEPRGAGRQGERPPRLRPSADAGQGFLERDSPSSQPRQPTRRRSRVERAADSRKLCLGAGQARGSEPTGAARAALGAGAPSGSTFAAGRVRQATGLRTIGPRASGTGAAGSLTGGRRGDRPARPRQGTSPLGTHLPAEPGMPLPWGCGHGEGTPLTYFSYSALSRSQRESLCFCQSLPCLQVVRRTTSSPLWT